MGDKIFVSYSTNDTALANEIVSYLESNGFPCWIAPRDIISGMDYTDLLNSALTECRSLLLIVSDQSVKSQWVKKEVTTAVSFNKNIIPYLITPTELRGGLLFMLNNLQWIDATKDPRGKFHEIIEGLSNDSDIAKPLPDSITKQHKNNLGPKMWTIIALLAISVALVAAMLFIMLKPKADQNPATNTTTTDTVLPAIDTNDTSTKPDDKKTKTTKEEPTTQTKKDSKTGTDKKNITDSTQPSNETIIDPPQPPPQQPSDYNIKYKIANNQLNRGNYQDALKRFESLKSLYPEKSSELEPLIKICKDNL